GSADLTLKLWEVSSGRCLSTFEGHTDSVTSVCLSADGRFALSGSADKTLKLWEGASGRCLDTLTGHLAGVLAVSLSKDTWFARSGGSDGTLRVWYFDWKLAAHPPADWDERARPYLKAFLAQHAQGWMSRWRGPRWQESDFDQLLAKLRDAGYAWLRPAGVRAQLESMAASWQDRPSS
ncbi:MAG TPA: serine/threonine protein kinase, partial [Ktedonobacteraceae bacterium]